jgi:hypothetical protein
VPSTIRSPSVTSGAWYRRTPDAGAWRTTSGLVAPICARGAFALAAVALAALRVIG